MKLRFLLLFSFLCILGFSQEKPSLKKMKAAHKLESEVVQLEGIRELKAKKWTAERAEIKKADFHRTAPLSQVNETVRVDFNSDRMLNATKHPAKSSFKIAKQTERNSSPFESVKGKRELTSKRDMFSKTYDNGDGSYTALIGAGPIHYERNGQFLDIDHGITVNFDHSYPYVNASNLFQSYFGRSPSTGIKNKTEEGELREFLNTKMYWEVNGQPHGILTAADVPVQTEDNKAYYRNIYGSIDAEFTVLSGKRELNYIIPNKEALGDIPQTAEYLVFSEDVLLPPGWTHQLTAEGIVIKNALGQNVYLYSNPISRDAEFKLEKGKNTLYETRLIGNTLTVLTKVKTDWLLSNERVYPVKVDPTVSVTPNNTNRHSISVYDDGDENETVGYFGVVVGYSLQYHIRFNTSTIPASSTINSATGYLNIYGHGGDYWLGASPYEAFVFKNSSDPVTTSGTTLFNSATNVLSFRSPDLGWGWGWHDTVLTNQGITYLQTNYSSGAVSFATCPDGNYEFIDFFAAEDHTTGTLRPYIEIDYTPPAGSCVPPSNPDVDTITHNSARLTWTAASPAPANGYDIYWNSTGTAPAPATTPNVTGHTGTNYTASLTPNTVYHFWIRSRCSGIN